MPNIRDSIDEQFRDFADDMKNGLRSGLNDIQSGGYGKLFGMAHLKEIRGILSRARDERNQVLGADGLSGYLRATPEEMKTQQYKNMTKELDNISWKAGGGVWDEAFKFATGHGYTGVARAGAIGARGAMVAGAVAAADFLNPFGFGSVKD